MNIIGLLRVFCSIATVIAFGFAVSATPAQAQRNPFESGWSLQSDISALNFQSVKKQTVVESSSFATLTGTINEAGATEVKVLLDSVDTKIDLRNVRMRFLFFETFKFPEATITTQIDPNVLSDLESVRRKQVPVTFTIDLHGVTQTYSADVAVTLLSRDLVSVASRTPISIPVADFDLMGGLEKLQEAANVTIIPSATISFDFIFARNAPSATGAAPAPAAKPAKPATVALETSGNFDLEACKGRFEILSRTGNIYFASGSARLEEKSAPLLNALGDIMARCPGMVIEIGGHTDSVGSAAMNERLSERRAGSVVTYLQGRGLGGDAMVARGYGETQPIASNATKKGRWDNRRIGFKVLSN